MLKGALSKMTAAPVVKSPQFASGFSGDQA